MDALIQILILAAFMLAGALLHRLHLAPKPLLTDWLIKLVLWVLLAVMGFRLGNSRELLARIGEIGLVAAATATFALIGTVVCINLAYSLALRLQRPGKNGVGARPAAHTGHRGNLRQTIAHFKGPGLLLLMVLLGGIAGVLLPEYKNLDYGLITTWVLNALLFMIGVQFAQSGLSLKAAFVRLDTLLIPLATVVGSLLGGVVVAVLFRLAIGQGMALAAGFGWYSLSGVMITNLGDPILGSAAFLANMIREALALLLIPLLARGRHPYTAIGAGGATAMDVTLPLIEQCTGPDSVPVSFTSGALLSLLVPVLVPLCWALPF